MVEPTLPHTLSLHMLLCLYPSTLHMLLCFTYVAMLIPLYKIAWFKFKALPSFKLSKHHDFHHDFFKSFKPNMTHLTFIHLKYLIAKYESSMIHETWLYLTYMSHMFYEIPWISMKFYFSYFTKMDLALKPLVWTEPV